MAPGNWNLKINAHFNGVWTNIEITRAGIDCKKREWAIVARLNGVTFYRKKREERIFTPTPFRSHDFVLARINRRHAALRRKPAIVQ